MPSRLALVSFLVCFFGNFGTGFSQQPLERLKYRNPGLVVDLGVGLWAWPMVLDWDHDGDFDLLVACPDKPSNGVYLFENPSSPAEKYPLLKPGKRLGPARHNMRLTWDRDRPRLLADNLEFPDFLQGDFETTKEIYPEKFVVKAERIRQNPWQFADFDGDGNTDLVVGQDIWDDFGWFSRNEWWKGYDSRGNWTFGPLRGQLFWLRNTGTSDSPQYALPIRLESQGKPLETYGWPSPCLADFDGDSDLDIICGEFRDSFTYFENTGTRSAPLYTPGTLLTLPDSDRPLTMDLQMIVPTPVDWDKDGDIDLVVGDEDGRVAFIEHTGQIRNSRPQFLPPVYFRQEADELKCGALATPVGIDWDGDGDQDIVSGNTAGYIEFFENLSGNGVEEPRWNAPQKLLADGKTIRIQAGSNGSIQGPAESKWGYTTLSVADWDQDQLPDLIVNSIWGKVHWYRNTGSRTKPALAQARPLTVVWNGPPQKPLWYWWQPDQNQFVTQWRTTPVVVDFTRDGKPDLVMLDHEGYLSLLERRDNSDGKGELLPPRRVLCNEASQPLHLNPNQAGRSGRRKLCSVDWDGDNQLDFLVNSENARLLRQLSTTENLWHFQDLGNLSMRNIEGHDTSPTPVDFNDNGIPDLVIGAEDGHFYYLRNPRSAP